MLDETELRDGLGRMIRVDAADVPQSLVDDLIDQPSLEDAYAAAVDSPFVSGSKLALTYFEVYLGRIPAADGMTFWTQALNGADIEDAGDDGDPAAIARAFVDSDEWLAQFGNDPSPEGVVIDMFDNVLGRTPSFEGLTFWTNVTNQRIQDNLDAGLSQEEAEARAFVRLGVDFIFADETQSRYEGSIETVLIEAALNGDDVFSDNAGDSLLDFTGTFRPTVTQTGPNDYTLDLDAVDGATEMTGIDAVGSPDEIDSLRLTGDASARFDLTDPREQLEQIDINGDGVIEPGTVEFNVRDQANVQYMDIIDAHPRGDALLDPTDSTDGFTGDLLVDGTGFDGSGTNLSGNIVLGGYGSDEIITGNGNDFISTGGLDDVIKAGRNADFIYQELSRLDDAFSGDDGEIDGGATFDDTAAADSDWLLLEASDDEEPVSVTLRSRATSHGFVDEPF